MTPQHDSIEAFLAMGGYGGFVWGSYAIALLVLALNVLLPLRRNKRIRSRLARRHRSKRSQTAPNSVGYR